MRYVDGYVLPIPRKNLPAYRRMARLAGKVWREHGALDYKECAGDDLKKTEWTVPFSRMMKLKPGETAWCCELVTRQDDTIIDAIAGNIKTKESEVLVQALDEQLGSDARRWEVGRDAQHLLITTDPSLRRDGAIGVPPPEMIVGLPWKRHLPKSPLGATLNSLIEDAAKLLESHPINRVRIDLGENPANLLWLWGSVGGESAQPPWSARTGLAGAVISNGFMVRGLALAMGLEWKSGPSSIEEAPLAHALKTVAGLLERPGERRPCARVVFHHHNRRTSHFQAG